MGVAAVDSGRLIQRYRRRPTACLYCARTDLTDEHVVGEAIGGRLTVQLLCHEHNNGIGNALDGPYAKEMAPIVAFLGVERHSGQTGATFAAKLDDGTAVRISADGKIGSATLGQHEKDARGTFTRVEGSLEVLDRLAKAGKIAPEAGPVIATPREPPAINTSVSAGPRSEAMALKMALHFVAGFMTDIPRGVVCGLLPYLVTGARCAPEYVRSFVPASGVFELSWPPSHEILAFPQADAMLVLVRQFGLQTYVVRLPMASQDVVGHGYRQLLGPRVSPPEFIESVQGPPPDWERRPSDADLQAFDTFAREWNQRLGGSAGRRDVVRRAERAASRARDERKRSGIPLLDCYKAELQIERFEEDQVETLVRMGRELLSKGRDLADLDEARITVRLDPS